MKKKTGYILASVLFFVGGACFLIAAVMNSLKAFSNEAPAYAQVLNQYGFYIAAACLLVAGAGFLHSYLKKRNQ